jgi:hypothetical protein
MGQGERGRDVRDELPHEVRRGRLQLLERQAHGLDGGGIGAVDDHQPLSAIDDAQQGGDDGGAAEQPPHPLAR